MYQSSYLSHLHPCIFCHSDDVTRSNETLAFKILELWFCSMLFAGQLYFSPELNFRLISSLTTIILRDRLSDCQTDAVSSRGASSAK